MLEGHHKVFTELCPEFTFTFEEYAWAMKTVQSRQTQIHTPDNKVFLCLIPGVDIINVSQTPNCALQWDEKKGIITVVATHDVPKFEQLTIGLGDQYTNADYLLNWGFVFPLNPKRVVQLPTQLEEKHPHYEEKKKLVDDEVANNFMVPGGFSINHNTMLSRMRFYAAKEVDWIEGWKNKFFNEWEQDVMRGRQGAINENVAAIQDGYGTWGGGSSLPPKPKYTACNILTPQSLENEIAAWECLTKFAEAALAKFPQTLEEDEKLMEKDSKEYHLTYNQRNCLFIRYE